MEAQDTPTKNCWARLTTQNFTAHLDCHTETLWEVGPGHLHLDKLLGTSCPLHVRSPVFPAGHSVLALNLFLGFKQALGFWMERQYALPPPYLIVGEASQGRVSPNCA